MTNEEKATQIASDVCGFTPSIEKWDITGEWSCAEDAALKMAEWKDKQLKQLKETKYAFIAFCHNIMNGMYVSVEDAAKEQLEYLEDLNHE